MSVLANVARSFRAGTTRPSPVPLGDRIASGLLTALQNNNDPDAQMRLLTRNGTLFATIELLSSSVAEVDWHLFRHSNGRGRISGPDPRREVDSHAALDLWNRPNDFMDRDFFVELTQQYIDVTGKAHWILDPSPVGPLSMWPVMPSRMVPVPDRKKFLAGWVYLAPNGQQIPFTTDEVIWIRKPHLLDPYDGLSAVEPLMSDIESAHYISEWNRKFFENSAQPGGFVQFPERLSDDQFDELTERWDEQHRGVNKAHRVAFLEMGATWQPGGYSMADMQFAELRKDSRDVTYEGFGVSKGMLGVVDDVNRANIEGSEYIYSKYRLRNRLKRIRSAANNQLLPKFGATGAGVEFDFEDPVPADWQADSATLREQGKAALELIEAGYHPEDVTDAVGMPRMRYLGPPARLALPSPAQEAADTNANNTSQGDA
jgi:HK97 family phage portal protein